MKFESIQANKEFYFIPHKSLPEIQVKNIITPNAQISLTELRKLDSKVEISLKRNMIATVFTLPLITDLNKAELQIKNVVSNLRKLA